VEEGGPDDQDTQILIPGELVQGMRRSGGKHTPISKKKKKDFQLGCHGGETRVKKARLTASWQHITAVGRTLKIASAIVGSVVTGVESHAKIAQ